jgi:Zn-dependent M32 family carboxypeptidase
VHQVGQRATAEGIVAKATGRGLDAAAFFRYLEAKSAALKL